METGEHQIVKPVDVILSAKVEASSPVKDTDSVSPSQHGAAAFDGSSSDDEEDGPGLQQEQVRAIKPDIVLPCGCQERRAPLDSARAHPPVLACCEAAFLRAQHR